MDMLLKGSDLCRGIVVLPSKSVEAQSRNRWNAVIVRISNDLQQFGRAIAALGRDDTELGHVSADRVRQHGSLTHQKLTAAMQHTSRPLLVRFCWQETHRRQGYWRAKLGGIVRLVQAQLEIGLHLARWDELARVAESLKLAAPMMGARA